MVAMFVVIKGVSVENVIGLIKLIYKLVRSNLSKL